MTTETSIDLFDLFAEVAAELETDAGKARAAAYLAEVEALKPKSEPTAMEREIARFERLTARAEAMPADLRCRRCKGLGAIYKYSHVDGGECFTCEGTGERRSARD
jgi:DnaJ-class molecular chaperone